MKRHFSLTQPFPYSTQWSAQGGWEERGFQSWGEGGVEEEDRRCMIKAYILKSLTSPLVWLMGPASQSDRGKGLEKWCNYCFLNRGLKRPAWKEDLEEILQGILDSRLPHFHPNIPPATHPEAPQHYFNPSPLRRLSSGLVACFTGPLSELGEHAINCD